MFAIFGICGLIIFILVRPQEFLPLLQRVPFLHLFTAFAAMGWLIDVRLRRLKPIAAPTLPWVFALVIWAIVGIAVIAPEQVMRAIVELMTVFLLYATIAHGIQHLRTLQTVVGVLATACLFITVVCFHQGLAEKQCIGGVEEVEGQISGTPDGRVCEEHKQCFGPGAEPGLEYRCEHVGLFGTYSVDERVRYRGDLHDPNEVGLTISAGSLSLLIGFILRKRRSFRVPFYALGIAITFYAVYMTQSRGGLMAAMLVPGVYLVRRYGWKAMIPAALVAVPVMMFGGRSGEAADVSNMGRYEAWATGIDMFKHSPIFGVGMRHFAEHHYLTAHNSFVLTLAELGFPGFVLFVSVIYLTFKCLIVGLRFLRDIPGTDAPKTWGMALLASMAGIGFQINTLSFAYHPVLWIFIGLVGAWVQTIRTHRPEFQVHLSWRDLIIIVVACAAYATVIIPVFVRLKGA